MTIGSDVDKSADVCIAFGGSLRCIETGSKDAFGGQMVGLSNVTRLFSPSSDHAASSVPLHEGRESETRFPLEPIPDRRPIHIEGDEAASAVLHRAASFKKALSLQTKLPDDLVAVEHVSSKTSRLSIKNVTEGIADARHLEIGCRLGSTACAAMYALTARQHSDGFNIAIDRKALSVPDDIQSR